MRQYVLSGRSHVKTWLISVAVCPVAEDGVEKFRCPLSRGLGRDFCIDDNDLCNGRYDCPEHEDEDPTMCLFYHVVSAAWLDSKPRLHGAAAMI